MFIILLAFRHTHNSSSTLCILPHFCHISLNTLLLVSFRFVLCFPFFFCGTHFITFARKPVSHHITRSPTHRKLQQTPRHTKFLLFSNYNRQSHWLGLLALVYNSIRYSVAFSWFELLVLIYHPFPNTAHCRCKWSCIDLTHTYIHTHVDLQR